MFYVLIICLRLASCFTQRLPCPTNLFLVLITLYMQDFKSAKFTHSNVLFLIQITIIYNWRNKCGNTFFGIDQPTILHLFE